MILNGKPTKLMPEITKNELKHIRLLRQKKYRQQFGEFVVEGEKNVDELINSALEIKRLFATQDWDSINYEGEITTSSNKQLAQLSNLSTPNKVVALAKIPNFAPVADPLLQKSPPKKAGANCAINTNEINPIETKDRSKVKNL